MLWVHESFTVSAIRRIPLQKTRRPLLSAMRRRAARIRSDRLEEFMIRVIKISRYVSYGDGELWPKFGQTDLTPDTELSQSESYSATKTARRGSANTSFRGLNRYRLENWRRGHLFSSVTIRFSKIARYVSDVDGGVRLKFGQTISRHE